MCFNTGLLTEHGADIYAYFIKNTNPNKKAGQEWFLYMINGLLENAVKKIVDKVKRNYKLAIPQYYTDKSTKKAKIQLLLPLFLQSRDVADLALVVDKGEYNYVGKTILTIEWAYVNYVYYIYKVYSKNAIFKSIIRFIR